MANGPSPGQSGAVITVRGRHGRVLPPEFAAFWKSNKFIDVIMRCGEETFFGHRVLITAQSGYFRRLLADNADDGQCTVVMDDTDPACLALCLQFLYTGHIDVPVDDFAALSNLARELEIDTLHVQCRVAQLREVEVDVENCAEMWCVSEAAGDAALMARCRGYCLDNVVGVLGSAGFRTMCERCVGDYISDNKLAAHVKPEHRLAALFVWVNGAEGRGQYVDALLRRLPLQRVNTFCLLQALSHPALQEQVAARETINLAVQGRQEEEVGVELSDIKTRATAGAARILRRSGFALQRKTSRQVPLLPSRTASQQETGAQWEFDGDTATTPGGEAGPGGGASNGVGPNAGGLYSVGGVNHKGGANPGGPNHGGLSPNSKSTHDSKQKPGSGTKSKASPGAKRKKLRETLKSKASPRTKPKSSPGSKPNSSPGSKPNSSTGSKPNSSPGSKSNSSSDTKPNSSPGTNSNSSPGTNSNSSFDTKSKPNSDLKSKPSSDTKSKPSPGKSSPNKPRAHPAPGPAVPCLVCVGVRPFYRGELGEPCSDVIAMAEGFDEELRGVGRLPVTLPGEADVACCVLDNKLYVTGLGRGRVECHCCDVSTGQWARCGDLSSERRGHCMAVVGGRLYVLGGWSLTSTPDIVQPVEVLEEGGTWDVVGTLPGARYFSSYSTVVHDKILTFAIDFVNDSRFVLLEYSTASQRGVRAAEFPKDNVSCSVLVVASSVVIFGLYSTAVYSLHPPDDEDGGPRLEAWDRSLYRLPNVQCLVTTSHDQQHVYAIGGKSRRGGPGYEPVYRAPVKDVVANTGLGWEKVTARWALRPCALWPGATCRANIALNSLDRCQVRWSAPSTPCSLM